MCRTIVYCIFSLKFSVSVRGFYSMCTGTLSQFYVLLLISRTTRDLESHPLSSTLKLKTSICPTCPIFPRCTSSPWSRYESWTWVSGTVPKGPIPLLRSFRQLLVTDLTSNHGSHLSSCSGYFSYVSVSLFFLSLRLHLEDGYYWNLRARILCTPLECGSFYRLF